MSKFIRSRGAVLIVVLGILVVLALMATSFAALQQIDRKIAKNYLDEVRARLVAQTGVEFAAGRVLLPFELGTVVDPSMTYWGVNIDEQGEIDAKTPIEYARNPSYAWEDEPTQDPADPIVKPLLLNLNGKDVGFSGSNETGTYGPHSDLYRLRVADANSMIHLNDGLENGMTGNVSQNLARILDNLCLVLRISRRGQIIVQKRPREGYRSKRDLLKIFNPAEFEKIRPFVTAGAWEDADVVNPVPLTAQVAQRYYPVDYNQQIGLYRYGRGKDSMGNRIATPLEFAVTQGDIHKDGIAVIAMDELNAQWIERCKRAPVNMNLASREVLLAVLTGLQGFYVCERRRDNPLTYGTVKFDKGAYAGSWWEMTAYSFAFQTRYDLSPGGPLFGDEYGFLYATFPFNFTGGTTTGSGVGLANKIADEIVACRTKSVSKHARVRGRDVDYSKVWFGGPFTSWRQFNAFCDHLVVSGVLVDPRLGMHMDYREGGPQSGSDEWWLFTGSNLMQRTPEQAKQAAQAMADVLKANFNPNLTLNEINPDANLYTLIDKTDLIVNSTEFCFTPMGYYEIESEGLVVRPTKPNEDLFKAGSGEIVARKKIECTLKAYDALRHTHQADFNEGTVGDRGPGSLRTNSNRSLELGPEPYNGPAAQDCRWGGWIQLSTLGGHWGGTGESHVPGTTVSTLAGAREAGSVLHGHFSLDHRLHHHTNNGEEPLKGANPLPGNKYKFENRPDWSEDALGIKGPYGPTVGTPGRYRLARDYQLKGNPPKPDISGGTGSVSGHVAVSDLRIDGAYVERDSCLMYPCDTQILGSPGTVSYWVKPSFHPEFAVRPRTFFSIGAPSEVEYIPGDHARHSWTQGTPGKFGWGRPGSISYQRIIGQWFLASHGAPWYESDPSWVKFLYGRGPWHAGSLVAGYETPSAYGEHPPEIDGWGSSRWPGGGVGFVSNSLNHTNHNHAATEDRIRHHRWTHITFHWQFPDRWPADRKWSATRKDVGDACTFLVNGKGGVMRGGKPAAGNEKWIFDVHVHPMKFNIDKWFTGLNGAGVIENPVRLGEVSTWNPRNWPADATLDEFYMWKGEQTLLALQQKQDGRYYLPLTGREGRYLSKPIRFDAGTGSSRQLPMSTGGKTTTASGSSAGPLRTKVLAVAWTWYPEETVAETYGSGGAPLAPGSPVMRDLNRPWGSDFIKPEVEITLQVNKDPQSLPLTNDGGTTVPELYLNATDTLRYEILFRVTAAKGLPNPDIGTALTATPVVDDVTIYFTGGLEYLSYEIVETSL